MPGNIEIIKWIWRAAKGNRLQAVLNATIGMLQVGASLLGVWAVQNAIDIASSSSGYSKGLLKVLPEGMRADSIYSAVGIMALIILFEFALSISSVWVRNILGVRAQNRMQQRMLDRILRSEWRSKEVYHSGDIMNRLESDVATVVNFITETVPSVLSTLTLFCGAFVYLFSMDKTLALLTVVIIPLCLLLSKVYVRRMRKLNKAVRDSDSNIQSVLQETVQNRMLIKTLESDDAMIDRLEQSQQTLRHRVVKRTAFSISAKLITNIGFAGSYLLAFLWSSLRLSAGTLSFGDMTAFLQLVNRIQSPAKSLSKLIPAAVSVLTAAERLMELEQVPMEQQGDPLLMSSPCGLRFNNVTFHYADDPATDVIKNFSFDFRPATATALVGETGVGKTTLIHLMLSLLKPSNGNIEIYSNAKSDYSPYVSFSLPTEMPVDSLCTGKAELSPLHRCNFVYVPQGNTLMSGTIRDNLLLGKPDATDEELREVLTISCADFVFSLPDGVDTKCTESGGGLSQGQAQRIAIARALLRNRPIMLFDEATSALDPATERQLLENILASKQKTVIFITHRMAVCDYCDQTLSL